ncbi:TRAP transporter substrate-binding protein [Pelagibius sp. Alg239-R121]|uniref:TRAP transporter substrate-binding protein n=1 Tax=Pelagibius sp. Alg239-R121 TaxID=2993448 RepID=UPI0024A721A0|nr:TRAP transporter substrate-binding protein [Pelagibius sp. Alg239-R121]
MKRRKFLKSAAAGAAATTAAAASATSLVAPVIAKEQIEWRMVTPWPKNAPGVGVNAQRLADRITAMSGGRLTVTLYAGGELVPPFGVFDAVRDGAAEMGHATPYYWQDKSKALHYFTGLPLGLTAWERAGWLYYGGGQELWDEVYAEFGLKAFFAGSSGVQAGGWFRKEITGLADLQGLKMRISGLGGEALAHLGVMPVRTPPGKIFAAMESGEVDAAEWIGPWNDLAFGLHKIAKNYYLPAFHEGGPALEALVNKDLYASLPSDLQVIVAAACSAAANETFADFTYHNSVSLDPLVEEHGVILREWPDEVVIALGKATNDVIEDLAATDAMTKKVHASYSSYLQDARKWSAVGDQRFLAMREKASD